MKKQFPIGFWNYVNVKKQTPDDVGDWKELGMTLANSPSFSEGDDPARMLAVLDACAENGIAVNVCDERTLWTDASVAPVAYEAKFRAAYDAFGHHPAVRGFHIGDEPLDDRSFADCEAAFAVQHRVAPELRPFLNLNPYWKGIEKDLHCTDFSEWLAQLAKKTQMPAVSYDMYGQMAPQPGGVEDYFTNLRLFSAGAREAGVDLWTTLLCVGHYHYRCPNDDDFRWQINTAVASGVKGIMWFCIYEPSISNYRLAPFDSFGERTATFSMLSRANRSFLHRFGDFFTDAKFCGAYHFKQAFGGYPLFKPGETDARLTAITTDYGESPAIVGFFEKEGQKCVALVNNSQRESTLFHPHFSKKAGVASVSKMTWDGDFKPLTYNPSDVEFRETEDEIVLDAWLAPGQMDLYRLEENTCTDRS